MIPYALRYNRAAIVGIYRIERGKAADVTLAIKALAQDPKPFQSFEIDIPDMRFIKVAGYFVTYEIVDTEHYIIVLAIEKDMREE